MPIIRKFFFLAWYPHRNAAYPSTFFHTADHGKEAGKYQCFKVATHQWDGPSSFQELGPDLLLTESSNQQDF